MADELVKPADVPSVERLHPRIGHWRTLRPIWGGALSVLHPRLDQRGDVGLVHAILDAQFQCGALDGRATRADSSKESFPVDGRRGQCREGVASCLVAAEGVLAKAEDAASFNTVMPANASQLVTGHGVVEVRVEGAAMGLRDRDIVLRVDPIVLAPIVVRACHHPAKERNRMRVRAWVGAEVHVGEGGGWRSSLGPCGYASWEGGDDQGG